MTRKWYAYVALLGSCIGGMPTTEERARAHFWEYARVAARNGGTAVLSDGRKFRQVFVARLPETGLYINLRGAAQSVLPTALTALPTPQEWAKL